MEEKEKTVLEIASLGGKTAAINMSKEQKIARAQKAATKRWSKNLPQSTHVGELDLAGRKIACAVLNDGRRVLNVRTIIQALGRKGNLTTSGVKEDGAFFKEPPFLTADNLKPFINNYLKVASFEPVRFLSKTGVDSYGYEANFLPVVCRIYLDARRDGALTKKQKHIAEACELLLAALAQVGIHALVDEATGFQYNRARDELQKILEQYVSKELVRWEKTFDVEFYIQMYRLKKWKLNSTTSRRNHQTARLTSDLIYNRIHPDLSKELKQVREDGGKPHSKLHQWLTTGPTGGHPRLKQQLEGVISLMSVAETWEQFQEWVNKRYPRYEETIKMLSSASEKK